MSYATAWLALHDIARIRTGDVVLIHSAAGGVGLAAVNICIGAGCKVYGTASTQEKRDYLLSMGTFNSKLQSIYLCFDLKLSIAFE